MSSLFGNWKADATYAGGNLHDWDARLLFSLPLFQYAMILQH